MFRIANYENHDEWGRFRVAVDLDRRYDDQETYRRTYEYLEKIGGFLLFNDEQKADATRRHMAIERSQGIHRGP